MPANPCHLARSHLSDYIDGEPLSAEAAAAVQLHLAMCPPCGLLRRSLEATREALRALRDADVAVAVDAGRDEGDEGAKK